MRYRTMLAVCAHVKTEYHSTVCNCLYRMLYWVFLPRDAVHKRGLCHRVVPGWGGCLCVTYFLSRWGQEAELAWAHNRLAICSRLLTVDQVWVEPATSRLRVRYSTTTPLHPHKFEPFSCTVEMLTNIVIYTVKTSSRRLSLGSEVNIESAYIDWRIFLGLVLNAKGKGKGGSYSGRSEGWVLISLTGRWACIGG